MTTRLAFAARLAAVLLPFTVGLVFGSLLARITLSWGKAFILWQLLWWLVVSVAVGVPTFFLADAVGPTIPRNIADQNLQRMHQLVDWSFLAGVAAILAGLSLSIWAMIAGHVASAPV